MQEFQAAGVVAFLMQVGTLVEELTAARARAGIQHLIQMQPQRATVRRDGDEVEIPADQLRPGDLIVVKAGDVIAADGEVTWGHSWANEAPITGESLPAEKQPGDTVYAGSTNGTGAMHVTVSRAGADTTLARIVALVVDAESQQSPIIRLADEFAGFFTPLILTVAIVVFVATGELDRSLSVLIVGCPCALILATPTAIVAAISAAARRGVLIKSGAHLEEAARIDTVFFDKTGTLTTGRLDLVGLEAIEPFREDDVLQMAAVAEKLGHHPLRDVLLAQADARSLPVDDPEQFQSEPGLGVTARWAGHDLAVGSLAFVSRRLAQAPERVAGQVGTFYVACDGRLAGVGRFRDRLRPEARDAVGRLRRLDVARVVILTGDRQEVADEVCAAIGADQAQAELLPEQKLDLVRSARSGGHHVAAVGDGINDAPALAAADLGVAMGASATPAALETADVALMEDRLDRLALLIAHARKTRRVICQSLIFAAAFNLGALVISSVGWLSPGGAALAHNISSVLVVLNSARLIRVPEAD